MRAGEPISARLLYPIYAANQLILPKDTIVTGSVVSLHPDRKRRVNAALGGDFTPFHIPHVRFNQIVLSDHTTVPLTAGLATNGTPIYRAVAPPPAKGGFFRREFNTGLDAARGDLAFYIAPGKGDRYLQWVYGRLPCHPQRIEKGTSWTIETAAAIDVPAKPADLPPGESVPAHKHHFWDQPELPTSSPSHDTGAWIVQANLADSIRL